MEKNTEMAQNAKSFTTKVNKEQENMSQLQKT